MSLKRAHSVSHFVPTKKKSTGSGLAPTPIPSSLPSGKQPAQVIRVLQGKSRHVDLKNGLSRVEYPPLDIFWVIFGDNASTQFLKSSPSLADYEHNVRYFHGRLALVVRGLNLDELSAVYRATLPAWAAHVEEDIQEGMMNSFESAYDWAQDCLLSRIKAYADLWFKSPAGIEYKKKWDYAASKKHPDRWPYPTDPSTPDDMLSLHDKEGLTFSRANVIDFFMVGLAAVETNYSDDESFVGWIKDDEDDTWYSALRSAGLVLILKYCMMQMNMPKGDIYELAVHMMIRSIVTFDVKDGFTPALKSRLVCKKTESPLSLDGLLPVMFEADGPYELPILESPDPIITSSPRITPGVRAASVFDKALLSPAPSSFTPGEGPTDEDHRRDHVKQLMALNKRLGIQPSVHRIDSLSPPAYAADKADAIGKMYAYLPLEAADEWHKTRMVHEAARLELIIAQAANRHGQIESRIAAIDRRRAQRAKQQDTIRQIKAANLQKQLELEAAEKKLQRQAQIDEAEEHARTKDPFLSSPVTNAGEESSAKTVRGSTAPLARMVLPNNNDFMRHRSFSVCSDSAEESKAPSPDDEETAAYMQEMMK